MESITLCLTKRKQVHPGDWSSPTPRVSIKTQIHKLFIDTDFFSICCGSGFRSGSRTIFFKQINMGDGSSTLPGLLWFGIKWQAYGFRPPHGLFGEIYAPSCGFIQDMCVCAMRKVQWAHVGNMQAFEGIFLFFPGSPFDFFSGILSVVEFLCIPGEMITNNHNDMLLFLGCLTELSAPLHVL